MININLNGNVSFNKEESRAMWLTFIFGFAIYSILKEIKLTELTFITCMFLSVWPLFAWAKILGKKNRTKDKKGLMSAIEKDLLVTAMNAVCMAATLFLGLYAISFSFHQLK